MGYCGWCGNQLLEVDPFCGFCGAKIESTELELTITRADVIDQPPSIVEFQSTTDGLSNKANETIIAHESAVQSHKRSKRNLSVGIAAIATLLVVGASAFAILNYKSSAQSNRFANDPHYSHVTDGFSQTGGGSASQPSSTSSGVSNPSCTQSALGSAISDYPNKVRIFAIYCNGIYAVANVDNYVAKIPPQYLYLSYSTGKWVSDSQLGQLDVITPPSFSGQVNQGILTAINIAQAQAQSQYETDLQFVDLYHPSPISAIPGEQLYFDQGLGSRESSSEPDFSGDPNGFFAIFSGGPTTGLHSAFFFQGTHFLGTNGPDSCSGSLALVSRTQSTFTIQYQIL